MANYSRSRIGDLIEGSTDGKYKKERPNTYDHDGLSTRETRRARAHLNYEWHGIGDAPYDKVAPGASSCCSGRACS